MKKTLFLIFLSAVFCLEASAQLMLPRDSQRQEISQVIGDNKVSVSYHRPNIKGRTIFGCQTTDILPKGGATYPCLVPYGQVWRTGANDATVIEFANDVNINGQKLAKGKYSLHTIPGASEWTIVFNKNWGQWGSFGYDVKDDALRVTAKPTATDFHETMTISIDNVKANSADFNIRWDKVSVPFTIDVGDVNARLLADSRRRFSSEPVQLANYVLSQKMTGSYEDALSWVENSVRMSETFANLQAKAKLLAELGRTKEAIETGEKAIAVGKAATPAANTAALEKTVAEWKAKK